MWYKYSDETAGPVILLQKLHTTTPHHIKMFKLVCVTIVYLFSPYEAINKVEARTTGEDVKVK